MPLIDAMACQGAQSSNASRGFAALIVGGLLLLTPAAFAQDAAPPQTPAVQTAPGNPAAPLEQPSAAPQPDAAPARRPGFFESVGRWFDDRGATFRAHLRGAKDSASALGEQATQNTRAIGETAAGASRSAVSTAVEATKDAVVVTKDAVGAVVKLPTARVMKGHERCGVAPNGAPDCLAAAQALCQKHGFSAGKSMDFTSAEECPARVNLLGPPARADCTTVTFISRAMCQ